MTIVYCSWETGNDTTGDGSAGTPWKTITKATTGRNAGDEVRVEKSPDPASLTGTVGFTLGSTAVTGSGTAFTSELTVGDFILAPDGQYYEVVTLTSDTAAVLYKVYPNATEDGFSSYKLGVTSTGAASGTGTAVQTVSASGDSSAFLYISGGWDLSNQQQTGQTYFRQMHGIFANRYGYGLYLSSNTYTNISRLHFLRYYTGINYSSSSNNTCTAPTCNSNSNYGIYIRSSSNNNTCTTPTCNSNSTGINYSSSYNNTCTTPTCNSNSTYGINYSSSSNNTCTTPTCNSNSNYGIYYSSSYNNTCTTPTCNSNSTGIYYNSSSNNLIYGTLSTTGNTSSAIVSAISGWNYIDTASIAETTKATGFASNADGRVYINDMGGYSYIYTDNGNIVSQDATAGGTGREWKFSPTDAIRNSVYPLWLPMARFAVASSGQVTVTAYFKKSGTGVAGALRCRYGQINWSDAAQDIIVNCPDNTSRNQVTLQFTPTEAGVVEIEALAWYVNSTTETVIVDDIAITQA